MLKKIILICLFTIVIGCRQNDTAVEQPLLYMPDDLEAPYTDAESVARAAGVVRAQFGEEGERYLRTLARYNPEGWPGITALVAWLATHDVARRTVRSRGLVRFMAASMLAGYFWLAVAGAVWGHSGQVCTAGSRLFADFSISCAMDSGNRSLRASMATLALVGGMLVMAAEV